MTDERQLHCYANGTDTVSAYSVEDARKWASDGRGLVCSTE